MSRWLTTLLYNTFQLTMLMRDLLNKNSSCGLLLRNFNLWATSAPKESLKIKPLKFLELHFESVRDSFSSSKFKRNFLNIRESTPEDIR